MLKIYIYIYSKYRKQSNFTKLLSAKNPEDKRDIFPAKETGNKFRRLKWLPDDLQQVKGTDF